MPETVTAYRLPSTPDWFALANPARPEDWGFWQDGDDEPSFAVTVPDMDPHIFTALVHVYQVGHSHGEKAGAAGVQRVIRGALGL